MAIQTEIKEVGGGIQLVANSEGWRIQQTQYELNPLLITGDPDVHLQASRELVEPLKLAWRTTKEQRPTDFNGLKVSVSRVTVKDGILTTEAYLTDYFTLWGIPKSAKEEFERNENGVVINRAAPPDAIYETSFPTGISTHNVLLDKNGDILVTVRAQNQGFYAGRASVTTDEQMDPDRDFSPFNASYRGYWEELGVFVNPSSVRLLGVASEKGQAYFSYCFVGHADLLASNIVGSWRKAPDYKDTTNLFSVPAGKIDEWLGGEVKSGTWDKYHLAGEIDPEAVLSLHPTVPWRVALVKEYIASTK